VTVSHFFAYLARMKFIRRWGLMHNTYPENIQEHSLRVATIAHALALIRNRVFGGHVSPERVAALALYHDASDRRSADAGEVLQSRDQDRLPGDREGRSAKVAGHAPREPTGAEYRPFFLAEEADRSHWELVKVADRLAAYIKCLEEIAAGNREFSKAEKALRTSVEALPLPEVRYFIETFVSSVTLTLDELG